MKLKELKRIEAQIKEEKQNVKLLTVDFEHLSRPQNLKKLMFLTPNLETVKTDQVIVIQEKMLQKDTHPK